MSRGKERRQRAAADRKILDRNLRVLAGRAHQEGVEPGEHVLVTWRHDDNCPGLAANSFILCTCMPEMEFEKLGKPRREHDS